MKNADTNTGGCSIHGPFAVCGHTDATCPDKAVEAKPTKEKLETSKKIFKFLSRTKFLEMLQSDKQFSEWLHPISYEDFIGHLTRINGILRDQPIKDRAVDGSKVELSAGELFGIVYLPPSAEQKQPLMQDGFKAVQELPDSIDRGLLLYYLLQAVHPYSDGNGRTGRLLYELVADSGKGVTLEKLSSLLDHDKAGSGGTTKGRDSFAEKVLEPRIAYAYINRELVKKLFGENFLKEYGSIHYSGFSGDAFVAPSAGVSSEESKLLSKILGEADVPNFSFRGISILKLLQEKPELAGSQYEVKRQLTDKGVVADGDGKKIFGIDEDKFMEKLTTENARRLIEINNEVKAKFIETMIDIFTNPQNHQMKTKDGKDAPVKSVFRL